MGGDYDRLELSLSVIEDLKGKGLSQSEIAELAGVTRQAVSWWVKTYDGSKTLRQEVLEHFPFKVPTNLSQSSPYRRLRDHGEYMATRGKGMSEDKLKRLRAFYHKLRVDHTVLEYDPTIPPIPGVSNKGGWAFRGRVPEDEDFLVRANEYTRLTEEGKNIWRFPVREP